MADSPQEVLYNLELMQSEMQEFIYEFSAEWSMESNNRRIALIARAKRARGRWLKTIHRLLGEKEHFKFERIKSPAWDEYNPDDDEDWRQWIETMKAHVFALYEDIKANPEQLKELMRKNEMPETPTPTHPESVFVVHGRNTRLNEAMFAFLTAIGLEPLEWSQAVLKTGKPLPSIPEILDAAFSYASAVVVLMTPDDEARLRKEHWGKNEQDFEKTLTPQARPNVLFEAGMAMASHPNQTVLVQVGRLRRFSDIDGLHLIHMNNSPERRQELAQRLKLAKSPVKTSGTRWFKVGDFEHKDEPPEDSLEESGEDLGLRAVGLTLLKLAAESKTHILIHEGFNANAVVINGVNFPADNDPQEAAMYKEAVEWLDEQGLVRTDDGVIFALRNAGYKMAETL